MTASAPFDPPVFDPGDEPINHTPGTSPVARLDAAIRRQIDRALRGGPEPRRPNRRERRATAARRKRRR